MNALVQHGAATDYVDNNRKSSKSKSNYHKKYQANSQQSTLLSKSSSGSSDTEPFYLHPPSIREQPQNGGLYNTRSRSPVEQIYGSVLPNDGLYINPMRNGCITPTSPSESVSGESFYLHDPQEVIYNRVKDLFDSDSGSNKNSTAMTRPNALTGKIY